MRGLIGILCALLPLLAAPASAKNGDEALNHYALLGLGDSAIGQKLALRFKAKGQPVFLVHNLATGLTQGDILRFQDKAALIDADIWQTLQAEGALAKLQASPLIRVMARGSEATWSDRASQVKGPQEKKAYRLGAELIKVLQENFGGLPGREQFLMAFDGANLELLAPREFLDQLRVVRVTETPTTGRPRFISPAPRPSHLVGEDFIWQSMAVDPADPDGFLKYQMAGSLPPGLFWDASLHRLQGKLERAGDYRLTAEVRNRQGARDTLAIHLTAQEDQPPQLAIFPKTMAFAGQKWAYDVLGSDPDHPGDSLRVQVLKLPPGMAYDAVTRHFEWLPGDSLIGRRFDLAFRLSDPMNRGDDYAYSIQVKPGSAVAWTQGIRIDLPFDTLIQGQTYAWQAGATALAWAEQGIVLKDVRGPDSTRYDGETLTIKPIRAGTHNVLFEFQTNMGPLQQARSFVVQEDRPPFFVSTLSSNQISVGQKIHYRPIAKDPENQAVSLGVYVPPGSRFYGLEDGELRLEARTPGLHTAQLVARDPSGHEATQWIAVRIEPNARPVAWTLENHVFAGLAAWTATLDLGAGRLGFYTPNLPAAFSFTGRSGRDWPFLFFGGNLLGHASESKGNRLIADLGFTLRLPDPKIATGGVYGRLKGEWSFPQLGFARIETEFTGHVRQALVLTDTSGIRFIFGEESIQLAERYDPVVRRIIRDATAEDNAAFFSSIQTYSRLGYGFWAGPGIWREDFPMDQRFYQRLGGGLRYQTHWQALLGQFNFRGGWGSGGAGWGLDASWRISWGSGF